MNSFRTEFDLQKSDLKIKHHSGVLTIGSCFSDEMGNLLQRNKFKVAVNPFGTVFNPVSIGRLLQWATIGKFPQEGFVSREGIVSNLHFHSKLSAFSQDQLVENINNRLEGVHRFLQTGEYLIVTLGTSWVYRHKDSGQIVSNCHKLPAHFFEKELLSTKETISHLEEAFRKIRDFNPKIHILLTVSPVRHTRDGMENNAVSKASLRLAAYHLSQNQNVSYFPSYELVLDDLRDYRFYADDLVHPNTQAIDYVWEKFGEIFFTNETREINRDIGSVVKAMEHRPLVEGTDQHISFIKKTISKILALKEKVDLADEQRELEKRLAKLAE